ncbi:MAG: hypothetical protein DHS20C14_15130 [Phycisphaeraceae bacterium]|nr:MAG: hypothetical protein DHS20C14_15130 [Phycisphaeraceae bacterium]
MNTKTNSRRAFSLVELLIALTITATLLTATLAAFDTSFKSYKVTNESASTNVVARIVMQRVTAMIRTGEEFGPYPVNPITTPVIESDRLEFVSFREPSTGTERVTTIERRPGVGDEGPWQLWYVITTYVNDIYSDSDEAPLLTGLTNLSFTLEYDVGPRLRRATIDMVIKPNDLQDAAIADELETPTIRLVASATPRRLDD